MEEPKEVIMLTLADGRVVRMPHAWKTIGNSCYSTLEIVRRAISAKDPVEIAPGHLVSSRYIIEAEVVETEDSA